MLIIPQNYHCFYLQKYSFAVAVCGPFQTLVGHNVCFDMQLMECRHPSDAIYALCCLILCFCGGFFCCYMRIVFTYADKQRFMWCHFEVGQGGNFAFQYPDGWLVNKRKIFSLVEIYNTTSTIQCRPKSIEYTTKRSDFNTNTNAFEWKYCAQLM